MKKITLKVLCFALILLSGIISNAQTDYYDAIPGDGSTSQNMRAPHGFFRYGRGVFLIKPTEMTASGIVNGDVINGLAFNYLIAQDIATSGTLVLYMQNTTDVTNTKSTTWATAITGMTTVSNAVMAVPNTVGNVNIAFSGGSPFTYTGSGVYVAFDFQNAAGAVPTTSATVDCNSTGLASGFKGAQSNAAAPTTLTASNFRPSVKLGKAVACARPTNLSFSNPTLTSVNLAYNVTLGGTVDIEYGPYNYTQGAGTLITNITNPYTLSSLTPSTAYEYYARKDCGGGTLSAWQGPYPFHTLFQPTNAPYSSGFEIEDFPFQGWLATPDNTANSWFINFGGTASPLVQAGEYSAIAITPTAVAANERLFSRGVNLNAGSTVTVTYYVRNYQATGSTNNANYQLTVGTDQTAGTQTTVIATETGISSTTFVQKTFNFTPTFTGPHYFSFLHNSPANATGTHAIIVDSFTVSEVLSSDSFSLTGVKMYPNPANDVLNIVSENEELTKVTIADLNGRIVKESTNNLSQISLGNLTSGIYMVTIESANAKKVEKLIVE